MYLTDEDLTKEVPFENGYHATIRWTRHIADHARHYYANIVCIKKTLKCS
ncbi:hypothetical protein FHS15_001524 [Paenibacillus castaneae]|nr:hypothetical protein [Paenibacillus castaneae]